MKETASIPGKERMLKRTVITDRTSYLPVMTFLITAILVLASFTFFDKLPFGGYSILSNDLRDQYVPELLKFKHHLKSVNISEILSSFSYSNASGLGKNYMSTFGYYLASPLNFIVFLFDDSHIATAVSVLSLVRLALGSSFMCLFLQKRSADNKSIWPLVFAVTYAFTSFADAFLINIIWFDAYMLLPLFLYFIERFIESNRKAGMAIVLIILFVSNFYMSYIVGLFSFFYLVGRLIYIGIIEGKITIKTALSKTGMFILTAVLSILSVAVLLIPVGINALTNRDVLERRVESGSAGFSVIEVIDQIFLGHPGSDYTLLDNPPLVFISLSVTFLVALFFVSKAFSMKEKAFYGTVTLLIYLSFIVPFIDMMWQAFDSPNWFLHRYSFVFMPVYLYLALRVFLNIRKTNNKEIIAVPCVLIVLLLVTGGIGKTSGNAGYYLVNISLTVVYSLLFICIRKNKWPDQIKILQKMFSVIMVLTLIIEIVGLAPFYSKETSVYFNGMNGEDYLKSSAELQAFVPYIEASGSGNRTAMECGGRNSRAPGISKSFGAEAVLGQNGTAQFDSSCNRRVSRFVKQFGYRLNFNYATYDCTYAALPTDAFLSVGSVVTTSDYENGLPVSVPGEAGVYRGYINECVLPVGFAVDRSAPDFDFYSLEQALTDKDYFDFQNRWYRSMFPEAFTGDIYEGIYKVTDSDITLNNAVKLNSDDQAIVPNMYEDPIGNEPADNASELEHAYKRTDGERPGELVIRHKVTHTGEQYIALVSSSLLSNFRVYSEGSELINIQPESYFSVILRLGYYEEGEEAEVTIESYDSCFSYQEIFMASVDDVSFKEQFGKIDLGKVTNDRYENGNAVFTTDLGSGEILLTTIPYENGWKCYVDGNETDIKIYENTFITVDPGEGVHKVELRFVAPGIRAGAVISFIGIISLAAFIYFSSDKRHKREKGIN